MEDLIALMTLFGDRYINVDDEHATANVLYDRDNMVASFNALIHFAEKIINENAIVNGVTFEMASGKINTERS